MRRFVIATTAFAVLVAASCAPEPRRPRQVDLDAWKGVPLTELETHPHFAILPLSKRTISDGRQVWDYRKCHSYTEDSLCTPVGAGLLPVWSCSGGEIGVRCCHDIFIVNGDHVDSLTLQSVNTSCYTTCEMRPSSRPCSADERN